MNATQESLKGVSGIYSAIHRDSGKCYVGSSVNIGDRMRRHIRESVGRCETAFHRALKNLGRENFDFEVLERCDPSLLLDREQFYISFLDSARNGFNTIETPKKTRFGTGVSQATRIRLSEAGRSSQKTLAHCRAMAEKSKGVKRRAVSEETKAKLRLANIGKKASEETRLKMSAKGKGRKIIFTPEIRAKMSAAARARKRAPHSDQTRAKMSESARSAHKSKRNRL